MSRFISAGAIDATTGEAITSSSSSVPTSSSTPSTDPKSSAWAAVTAQLETERKQREEARIKAASGQQEKSLYEVLQANKAAKQAAFEEASKLKNQFRALDEDEIEFLDEIEMRKREEEERRRKEVEEGLERLRRGKLKEEGEEYDGEEVEGLGDVTGVSFEVLGRKRGKGNGGEKGDRKRVKGLGFGVKRRVEGEEKSEVKGEEKGGEVKKGGVKEGESKASVSPPKPVKAPVVESKKPVGGGLLVDYGSDSD
ncbi:N-terminal domain of NEFA-interacting nuclear protein NIP30-domain-containing protein [Podospora fimiseda]|uniref:N-terminal domain of NEFA-interacting nuclear protein NIP30-domain-containing protein n=1 Tax=Podospora fimiseda TaxID=252190 RepID=A0AAN7BNU4_9PEZI|nr:N-terminal domain of NEFA-interacting nuclear protein NIP30-domain-containing protein [Podospora fimiseda]